MWTLVSFFEIFMSFVNVFLVTVELCVSPSTKTYSAGSNLSVFNLWFIVYYSIEQILMIVFVGPKRYFSHKHIWFESFTTWMLVMSMATYSHTATSPKNPNWASAITIESQNEIAEIEIENIVSMCLNAHWDNKIHVRGTCVGGMCSIAVTTLAWSWRDGAGNRFSNSHTESFILGWTGLDRIIQSDW